MDLLSPDDPVRRTIPRTIDTSEWPSVDSSRRWRATQGLPHVAKTLGVLRSVELRVAAFILDDGAPKLTQTGFLNASEQLPSVAHKEAVVIKVSVMYLHDPMSTFDMDYYRNKHVPMVRERLGGACKSAVIEAGLAGGEPGSPPTYCAMGHIYFDSVEAFQQAFAPHAAEIVADVANYTNAKYVIQISDVVA